MFERYESARSYGWPGSSSLLRNDSACHPGRLVTAEETRLRLRPYIDRGPRNGYTGGMKTAVSIPDELFEKAERLAKQSRKSRSQIFKEALADYVARHALDDVTDAMDRACAEVSDVRDGFVSAAARRALRRVEW